MNHPLHAICPYFAMFPPTFVIDQLLAYSSPKDLIFDPFSGRGTTVLEALLNDRDVIATDINLVAACVSGAKARVPALKDVLQRLSQLKRDYRNSTGVELQMPEFFQQCYHSQTLSEIIFLRHQLSWRVNHVDNFIAALMLGILHGESHRSSYCLSNRMPRTISTKPEYSIRWWRNKGYVAPMRKTFEILVGAAHMRYTKALPSRSGSVRLADARDASKVYNHLHGKVNLVITSPPYLDTTDFAEDQWLRLWFLGGSERPAARLNKDDRHTQSDMYWNFLTETWAGCRDLLHQNCKIVVRIGGRIPEDVMLESLTKTIACGLSNHKVRLHGRSSSEIKKRQTNVFRPGTSEGRREYDFVYSLG